MGRRNRQRGAELQRQVVNLAKDFDFEAYNRDRGALMISLPANRFFLLKKLALVNINKEAGGV